jgi:hypothetical protein
MLEVSSPITSARPMVRVVPPSRDWDLPKVVATTITPGSRTLTVVETLLRRSTVASARRRLRSDRPDGVESATSKPWSMIATRSHTACASSMEWFVDGGDEQGQPLLLPAGQLLEPPAQLLAEACRLQPGPELVPAEPQAVEPGIQPGDLFYAQFGLEA